MVVRKLLEGMVPLNQNDCGDLSVYDAPGGAHNLKQAPCRDSS